jgi:hypothetical protein
MVVEEPDDDGTAWTWTDHGVSRQTTGSLHSPHDSRLAIRMRQGGAVHAPLTGKADTISGPLRMRGVVRKGVILGDKGAAILD